MGTLARIRQTSPYILAIFAVVFIAFMVLSDMQVNKTGRSGPNRSEMSLLTVNGEEYSLAEFNAELKKLKDNQMKQNPENTDIDEAPIMRQIFEQKKKEMLVRQEAEKAGIFITDKEILDEVIENPYPGFADNFKDSTGNVNKDAYLYFYLQFISNPNGWVEQQFKTIEQNSGKKPTQEKMNELVNQAQMIWEYLIETEKRLFEQKREANMKTLLGVSSSVISNAFAERDYLNENSVASVNFLFFPTRGIHDSLVQVSDKEIEDYYQAHKQYYKQKPARKIKYITFKLGPAANDTSKLEEKVGHISKRLSRSDSIADKDKAFTDIMKNNFSETHDYQLIKDIDKNKLPYIINLKNREVAGPIRLNDGTYFFRLDDKREGKKQAVKSRHILLKFKGDDKHSKDSLKKEINKILKEVKKPDADFAAFAKKYSEDGSAQKGGDLGWYTKGGGFVKPFEDALMNNEPGTIVGPVETQFGYHIIKIEEKKSEEIKFSEVKLSIRVSDATKHNLERKIRKIYRLVSQEGKDFDAVAKEYNKVTHESHFFGENDPIINSQYLTDLVFQANVGEMLNYERTEIEKTYHLIQVIDERKAGLQKLEDVKEVIVRKLKQIKKLDVVKEKAEKAYQQVASYSSLAQADSTKLKSIKDLKNNGSVQGIGQDFVFTNSVFKAELNKITGPLRGENGYFIFEVLNRNIPSDPEIVKKGAEESADKLRKSLFPSAYMNWFRTAMDEATIEANRLNWNSRKY